MTEKVGLLKDIRKLYKKHIPEPEDRVLIDPFIGSAFTRPAADRLRIMGIGINAYRGAEDWNDLQQTSYPGWYRKSKDGKGRSLGFFTRARNQMNMVAEAVTAAGNLFNDKRNDGVESHYFTNVVKVIIDKKDGKNAAKVPEELKLQHGKILPEELSTMAAHGCFPHVIVLFSSGDGATWDILWQSFHPDAVKKCKREKLENVATIKFVPCEGGDAVHHANRIKVKVSGGRQDLLLLRLAHPSNQGNAHWNTSKTLANENVKGLIRG